MLENMLRLQQRLNDETNGLGWEKGRTQQGKPIDWRRCIWLEAAELVESYPWKHWKNIDAKPDYENIRIETVDIWHFVMSEALRLNVLERDGDIGKLARSIAATEAYRSFLKSSSHTHGDPYEEIDRVEGFVRTLFCGGSIEELTAAFFSVASQAGLDLAALYRLYIGKNILNRFRQEHGYKEGEYRKLWRGREDNVVMQEILQSQAKIEPERLYRLLEEKYRDAQI